jgi:glutamyl-tRNA synthetase
MSVTVSDSGGKLSKRERPKSLRLAINSMQSVDKEELAKIGGISVEDVEQFLKNKSVLDMPVIDAIAAHLGVHLPEINVVDFCKSGYLPEGMINFMALLGWNPGDDREVMPLDEVIESFDLSRMSKSNSLFDRKKLLSFNTDHIRDLADDKLMARFRAYLELIESPVANADDELLLKIIKMNDGARTLEQIEQKTRFAFFTNDAIEYDAKAVKKVLLKGTGLEMLKLVRDRLAAMEEITPESIEQALRSLAEEKEVGLGKVAQPLRVAICGNTVSPPIFDSVNMLGMENVLARIDITLGKFSSDSN